LASMRMVEHQRDLIYATAHHPVGDFVFDDRVARVFPDMIARSVPGYAALVDLIGVIARRHLQSGTRCYDLGCSRGAVALTVLAHTPGLDAEIVAVDSAPAMIRELCASLERVPESHRIRPVCADLASVRIEGASLVVLNLTLQFVPPHQRLELLRSVREGLEAGGVLVLSEKLDFEDVKTARVLTGLHEEFKRAQGYSELEISQKRAALERVLIPESLDKHRRRLARAGFARQVVWFQCLNFVSLMAWV